VSTDSILRNAPLRALLLAEIVSSLGSNMTYLALPWFVLVTTGSPARMSIVLAAELLPMALLGIPSGTVVTRLGARQTMILSDLARVPLLAAIPFLHEIGALSFPLLLVLVALMGCFWAPYFTAQRLVLPELLGDDERVIAQANSVVEAAQRLTLFAGPAAAGLLITWLGATSVLYLDAATFFLSFVLVTLFVPRRAPVEEAGESGGLFAGLGFIARDQLLRPLIVTLVGFGMLFQALFAALPVLAYEEYDRSPQIAGWLVGSWGAGALIGSVIAFNVVKRFQPLRLAAFAVAAGIPPLWLLAFHLPAVAVMAVLCISAAFSPLSNAPMIAVATMRTPEALRAKVMTAAITLNTVAGPVGLFAVGPLLEQFGVRPVFAGLAVGMTATAAFFSASTLAFDRRRSRLVPAEEA
jgi:MFS family permease